MTTTYRVVINGPKPGERASDVAVRLGALVKLPPEKIVSILSRPGVSVKRGIDLQQAEKYQAVFEQAGCQCAVEPEGATPPKGSAAPAKRINRPTGTSTQRSSTRPIDDMGSMETAQPASAPRTLDLKKWIGIAVAALVVAVALGWFLYESKTNSLPTVEVVIKDGRAKTVAGEIAVTAVKDSYGVTAHAISLAGRIVYDQNDYLLEIEKVFNISEKTVVLFGVSGGGNACPGNFRFMTVDKTGNVSVTDEFGTCSDVPKISVAQEAITVTLPDLSGRGDEVWKYANGGLSKTKLINPNIERNAPKLTFVDGAPLNVRGSIVRVADGKTWTLKLPQITHVLEGGSYGFCSQFQQFLPIADNISPPQVKGEADFKITIDCFRNGPVVMAIEERCSVAHKIEQMPAHTAARKGELFFEQAMSRIEASNYRTPPADDIDQIICLLSRAKEYGNVRAMTKLGDLYAVQIDKLGKGLDFQPKKALELWTQAANLGDAEGLYSVGWAYENAVGVPQDLDKAKQYYEQAEAKGSWRARNRLIGFAKYESEQRSARRGNDYRSNSLRCQQLKRAYDMNSGVQRDYAGMMMEENGCRF